MSDIPLPLGFQTSGVACGVRGDVGRLDFGLRASGRDVAQVRRASLEQEPVARRVTPGRLCEIHPMVCVIHGGFRRAQPVVDE